MKIKKSKEMIVKLNKSNIMKLKYILSTLIFAVSTLTYSQTVLDMATTEDDFSYTKNEISYVNGLLCDLDSTFTINRAGFVRNFLFFLLLKKLKSRSWSFCLLLKRLWI